LIINKNTTLLSTIKHSLISTTKQKGKERKEKRRKEMGWNDHTRLGTEGTQPMPL